MLKHSQFITNKLNITTMELVIKSSETLKDFAAKHGNSIKVIPNPQKNGHKFFACGDGTTGAVSAKLQSVKVDSSKPFAYQVCHCALASDPEGPTVPFLCPMGTGAEAEATFTF